VESEPNDMKTAISLISDTDKTSAKVISNVFFKYIFNLTGITDPETVKDLCAKIYQAKSPKELHTAFESVEFDQDKLVFFSTTKEAAAHKKNLRKFLKMLTQTSLDNLPQSEDLFGPII
jgi:hypothetical protein